jgi:hypothetical protein
LETLHLLEIAHILSGPVLGIFVTGLAFLDDHLIHKKFDAFFTASGTTPELKRETKDLMAGAIAFATFLGNVYLFVLNGVIATLMVFPAQHMTIVAIISAVTAASLVIQVGYLFYEYGVMDLGAGAAPFPGNKKRVADEKILYPKFLKWEQLALSIFVVVYFAIGIYLNPSLSGFNLSGINMKVPTEILLTFGPILLLIMGLYISVKPPPARGRAHWVWFLGFLVLGVPTVISRFITSHSTLSEQTTDQTRMAPDRAATGPSGEKAATGSSGENLNDQKGEYRPN